MNKQSKFSNSFRSANKDGTSPKKKPAMAEEVLGPVNRGYSQTYKGQLHMMSQAVSNQLAVSKSKLSQQVMSPKGHPVRAIHPGQQTISALHMEGQGTMMSRDNSGGLLPSIGQNSKYALSQTPSVLDQEFAQSIA